MKRTILAACVLVAIVLRAAGGDSAERRDARPAACRSSRSIPSWPKIPPKWELGEVTSIAIDAQDHAWVLHRPTTMYPHQKGKAAPSGAGV